MRTAARSIVAVAPAAGTIALLAAHNPVAAALEKRPLPLGGLEVYLPLTGTTLKSGGAVQHLAPSLTAARMAAPRCSTYPQVIAWPTFFAT